MPDSQHLNLIAEICSNRAGPRIRMQSHSRHMPNMRTHIVALFLVSDFGLNKNSIKSHKIRLFTNAHLGQKAIKA